MRLPHIKRAGYEAAGAETRLSCEACRGVPFLASLKLGRVTEGKPELNIEHSQSRVSDIPTVINYEVLPNV